MADRRTLLAQAAELIESCKPDNLEYALSLLKVKSASEATIFLRTASIPKIEAFVLALRDGSPPPPEPPKEFVPAEPCSQPWGWGCWERNGRGLVIKVRPAGTFDVFMTEMALVDVRKTIPIDFRSLVDSA